MAGTSLSDYWQAAGNRYGFRVLAPYTLLLGETSVSVAALLPDFGAPRGMLLTSDYASLQPYLSAIRLAGYGFSVLDPNSFEPNRGDIIDLLIDWGWSGAGTEPSWLSKA